MKGRRKQHMLLLVLSICSVAVTLFFNEAQDFCTTNCYGFPIQFYYDYCACEEGSFPIVIPFFLIDLIIHLIFWAALELIIIRIPVTAYTYINGELKSFLSD